MSKKPGVSRQVLANSLKMADAVSQRAGGGIESLCSLALLAMEQRSVPVQMEHLAEVLKQIIALSEDAQGCISAMAHDCGCEYEDPRWRSRFEAHRAWEKSIKTVEA